MTKPTKWHVSLAKTQISLGIRPVRSESSLSAWKKLGSLATHWALSEDSDQTWRMPRLIWGFARRTSHFVGFVTRRLFCSVNKFHRQLWASIVCDIFFYVYIQNKNTIAHNLHWLVCRRMMQVTTLSFWETESPRDPIISLFHSLLFLARTWEQATYSSNVWNSFIIRPLVGFKFY